MKYTIGQ